MGIRKELTSKILINLLLKDNTHANFFNKAGNIITNLIAKYYPVNKFTISLPYVCYI